MGSAFVRGAVPNRIRVCALLQRRLDSALSAAVKRGLCEASLALIARGADTDIMPRPRSEGGLSLLELAHRRPLMMARVVERLRGHVML